MALSTWAKSVSRSGIEALGAAACGLQFLVAGVKLLDALSTLGRKIRSMPRKILEHQKAVAEMIEMTKIVQASTILQTDVIGRILEDSAADALELLTLLQPLASKHDEQKAAKVWRAICGLKRETEIVERMGHLEERKTALILCIGLANTQLISTMDQNILDCTVSFQDSLHDLHHIRESVELLAGQLATLASNGTLTRSSGKPPLGEDTTLRAIALALPKLERLDQSLLKSQASMSQLALTLRENPSQNESQPSQPPQPNALPRLDITSGRQSIGTVTMPIVDSKDLNEGLQHFIVPVAQNALFTGRTDILEDINAYFVCDTPGQKRLVLTGLGGVGKTQIATAFTYSTHVQEDYSIVLWVFASDRGQIVKSFTEITAALGLKATKVAEGDLDDLDTLAPSAQELLRWLSCANCPKWLLVFDNVDDLDNIDIQTFFPKVPWGDILITSRREQAARFGHRILVDVMGEEEAVQLLYRCSRLSRDVTSAKGCRQLAKMLGYLPLALDQAGAYIAEQCIDFGTYMEIYEESRASLLRHKSPKAVWLYEETVFTTWEMSAATIMKSNSLAVELLALAAFFHSDNIPLSLIFELGQDPDPTYPVLLRNFVNFIKERFDYDRVIESVPDRFRVARSKLQLAIGKLASFSLLRHNAQAKSLQIHPLVHVWLMERQSEEDRRIYGRIAINLTLRALVNAYDLSRYRDAEIVYRQLFICLEHVHTLPGLLSPSDIHKVGACIIALDSWVPSCVEITTLRMADGFFKLLSDQRAPTDWVIPPAMLTMREALRLKSIGAHAQTAAYCARFFETFVPRTRYDRIYLACLARTSAPCSFRLGDLDSAEKVYSLADDSLDSTGLSFARKQLVLGAIKIDRGLLGEAEEILSACHRHILRSLGEEHFLLNVWYWLMSLTFIEMKQYEKAEAVIQPKVAKQLERFRTRQLLTFTFSDFELVECYTRILRCTHRYTVAISLLTDLLDTFGSNTTDTPTRALGQLSLLLAQLEALFEENHSGRTIALSEFQSLMDDTDRMFDKAAHAYAIEWNRGTWIFKHYPKIMAAQRMRLKSLAGNRCSLSEGVVQ